MPWGGFSITGAKALTLAEQTTSAVAAYADAIFVNSADHNLYFRNAAGTNVQITSGSTLNVSIVGGIGGDYSSVSALLSYDDATKRYLLQQEVVTLVRPWAGLAMARYRPLRGKRSPDLIAGQQQGHAPEPACARSELCGDNAGGASGVNCGRADELHRSSLGSDHQDADPLDPGVRRAVDPERRRKGE